MVRLLYVRCDCGSGPRGPAHYYRGEKCPFSGWTAPGVREARAAGAAVERTGEPLTVEALLSAGLSSEVLALVMVAEFAHGSVGPAALGIDSFGVEQQAEQCDPADPPAAGR